MQPTDPPILLDCTIRDGNYVVDFRFNEADTQLLTSELARLGFQWIEIGHGLGLGAMEAGKGRMPAGDIALIQAAKKKAKSSKIGMFFIPEIGSLNHLNEAADVGLDFIRIGDNAPEIERAFPYIEHARKLGLIPCLNMMKSYAISPKTFAQKARGAFEAGAEIVYCVDSAGCMFPEELANYFDETRQICSGKLGFHGHNNLMMAIPNCLSAYQHGAQYLDVTLCGLGRSPGNAPTEMLVAVFERQGIDTGIDLFNLMNTIDTYMWPLVSKSNPFDMMGVTAGYSKFHSSFLPKVSETAKRTGADLKRLVAMVAQHNAVNLDEDYLNNTANELAINQDTPIYETLLSFQAPGISPRKISNSHDSAKNLIDGLVTASAKQAGTRTALHLVPSEQELNDVIIPEFVLNDGQMILGRITYGSIDVLNQVLECAYPYISVFLVSSKTGWAHQAPQIISDKVGTNRTLWVQDAQLYELYLNEVLTRAAQSCGNESLLIYHPDITVLNALEKTQAFKNCFILGASKTASQFTNARVIRLDNLDDWKDLKLQFDVVFCHATPAPHDIKQLTQTLAPDGKILSFSSFPAPALINLAGDALIHIDPNLAYSGFLSRHQAIDSLFEKLCVAEY